MEIKLLKNLWQETELYEACNLPHPFLHLGMCQGVCQTARPVYVKIQAYVKVKKTQGLQ